jgi:hypothetical protein
MIEPLLAGSILVADGSVMPADIRVETDTYSPGWGMLRSVTRHTLEKAIQAAGWTFFFLAGAIRRTAYGFNRESSGLRALKRLLAEMDTNHLNCLEIEGVVRGSFLGLPYVTVTAHARHIQQGGVMSPSKRVHPIPYRNYV